MKKNFFIYLALIFASMVLFAAEPHDSLEKFTENTSALAQESTLALNTTASSFIGTVFPSIPPHFQFGLSFSGTIMETEHLTKAVKAIKDSDTTGTAAKLPDLVPLFVLPSYAVNLRLGGFYLPFDIGVSASFSVPPGGADFNLHDASVYARVINTGADLRYGILHDKKNLPDVSLGVGFAYNNHEYKFGATENNKSTSIKINLNTNILYGQMQISKRFAFLLPYVGARAFFANTNNRYSYSIKDNSEISKTADTPYSFETVQPQIYFGTGFMLPSSQITLNGSYNFLRSLWTVSLHGGFRL